MRIRKRFHSLITPADLSSPPPPSLAAAAVALNIGGAGGKQGGDTAAAAAAADAGGLHGLGGGSGGGGEAGEGRKGLHPNGDLPGEPFHGCTTKPTSLERFPPPPPAAATAGGEGRGGRPPLPRPHLPDTDVLPDHRNGGQVPKREQDGENGGDGDAHRRWNADAHSGGAVVAPKSSGAEVAKLLLGNGGYKTLPNGTPAEPATAEDMGSWSDGQKGFPLKKRRGLYRARGTRSSGGEEDEEEEEEGGVVAEREMNPGPSNTRRRRAAGSGSTRTAARTSAGALGAPAAAGAGRAAPRKCDWVKEEEGADVVPAAADGSNHGLGKGKKRRSPAVLMEGSRCSRVNGRGWRCCQQTLVGYSLCEHHLGKGRLRSVSSVRCNGRARKKEEADGAAAPSQKPSPLQQKQHQQLLLLSSGDGDNKEEDINPGKRRRRNKIGMVKARSISSLLHQPDPPTPTAMAAAPEPCTPISIPGSGYRCGNGSSSTP